MGISGRVGVQWTLDLLILACYCIGFVIFAAVHPAQGAPSRRCTGGWGGPRGDSPCLVGLVQRSEVHSVSNNEANNNNIFYLFIYCYK